MPDRRDLVVVGGGIVGLATAWQLLRRDPGRSVVVLERRPTLASEQSTRNSGVLHAGLYYAPGSAKARWCRAGKAALERYADARGVPVARRGKVVVAVRPDEVPRLRELAARARTNGVEVHELDADGVRDHEPHVTGLAGLWSPTTAVTDFGQVADALARDVRAAGGDIRLGAEVRDLEERGRVVRVETTGGDLEAATVITCAGLAADRLARVAGLALDERIVPFRGSWLELRADRRHLVRSNIYPVPTGGLPFLGVHLTRRLDGRVWIGPNAVVAGARTGRSPWSVDRRDAVETARFRGSWRLAREHWRVGVGELWRDRVLRATLREVQRYVPGIELDDVRRGPWGVRAQLVSADGRLVDDFVIREQGRIVHLLNAPSPAATSSLLIGEELAERACQRLR